MAKITKDTTISDILVKNPKNATLLTEIMMDFGINCVGCGASSFETLEQGVLGHGFSESQLDKLLKDLNEVVDKEGEEKTLNNFEIKFSGKAIEKLKNSKEKNKETLRVSVVGGGCSGFMYNLEFIEKPKKEDKVLDKNGLSVAIDKDSLEFLNGTIIDYIDTLNESGFKFNNPNSEQECGCGKSFN